LLEEGDPVEDEPPDEVPVELPDVLPDDEFDPSEVVTTPPSGSVVYATFAEASAARAANVSMVLFEDATALTAKTIPA